MRCVNSNFDSGATVFATFFYEFGRFEVAFDRPEFDRTQQCSFSLILRAYILQIYSRVPSAEASRAVVTTVVRANAAQTVVYYRQYRCVLAASPYNNAPPVTAVYRPPASIDTPTAAKPVQNATTSRSIKPA